MENFSLITLTEELEREAAGMVVRRIVQHHPRGFLFQTRSVRMRALKLLLEPRFPALYVSAVKRPTEGTTSEFLMVLRKHLVSARLLGIRKPLSERIVELEFKTSLPAKELETVTLVAELLPNSPNLFLLDGGRHILASFRSPPDARGLQNYGPYVYPTTTKVDLETLMGSDSDWWDAAAFEDDPRTWLIRNIAGVGPILAGELAHRQAAPEKPLPDVVRSVLKQLATPAVTAWVYSEQPFDVLLEHNDLDRLCRSILSPLELHSLDQTHSSRTFHGMLEGARFLFDRLEERALLERAKAPRLRKIRDQRRRIETRRARLGARKDRFRESASLQAAAQLLVSSGADMNQRRERIEVTDYGQDPPRTRTMELDPTHTIRENADRMFKRHRKATRGLAMLDRQILEAGAAIDRLRSEEERIAAIRDWTAWQATGPSNVASKPSDGESEHHRAPGPSRKLKRKAVLLDGHEVLIGRNSRENDDLTFHVAGADDFWFHVADYSGSHVIVRNPSREPDLEASLLERAAALAAYHSQARNSNKVQVHYTQRKFVRKPRRAKPGLVTLREFRTITVEPRNWTATS